MNIQIKTYEDINRSKWSELVKGSETGTWFQTPEAYDFYASLPGEFKPFVVGLCKLGSDPKIHNLRAICVGYITVAGNALKQMATARAIIIGGPALADDCSYEEVCALMKGVKAEVARLGGAIYIETRNFNDYSAYREGFEKAGFGYEEHNNFHVATASFAAANDNDNANVNQEIDYAKVVNGLMGKNRVRDIKTSFRDGAVVIEHPTIEQVREYYKILDHLYKTRVKTPLFPLAFFEKLWAHKDGRFLLVGLNGEIIGGTVCVEQEGKCLYEWFVAGRDGEWKSIFPSSVATYAGIRYAAEKGMPRFDMMGAGKPGDTYGVRDFKARFGGELVEHGRYLCVCKPLLYKCGEMGVQLLKKMK